MLTRFATARGQLLPPSILLLRRRFGFVSDAALPFLHRTEVFLYPVVVIVMLLVLSVVLGVLDFGPNMSRAVVKLYF